MSDAYTDPYTGATLTEIPLANAGLPPSVLNVVIGKGSEIGDPMVTHDIPRVVAFTGSTEVGAGIARKAGLKKLALELGGNAPLVVLDDADLDDAVRGAVFGNYLHQGQICIAINRVIVDTAVYDEFVPRFLEATRELRIGDPRDPETQLGPIINPGQLHTVHDKISRAVDTGAHLVLSGDPTGPTGQVLPPHVLLGGNGVATAAEEVFGPVATIVRADGEADALRLANETEYGLASAVFSGDVERGVRFALQIEAGSTHVNDMTVNYEPNTAFGGEKFSGLGRFGGDWGIEEFTTDHWISIQHTPHPLAL